MESKEAAPSELKNHSTDESVKGSEEEKEVKVKNEDRSERKVLRKTQLWKYADGRDILLIIVGIIAALVNGSFYSICMYCLKDIFNAINDSKRTVRDNALIILLLGIVSGIAGMIFITSFRVSSERQISRIRAKYFNVLLNQNSAWFDENDAKKLASRVIDDTNAMTQGIGMEFGKLFKALAQIITSFVIGFTQSWQVTLVYMAVAFPLGIVSFYIAGLTGKYYSGLQTANAESSGIVEESISSIKTVSSFGIENRFIDLFYKATEKAKQFTIKVSKMSGFSNGFMNFVFYNASGFAFWYGSYLIRKDKLDLMDDFRGSCPNISDYENRYDITLNLKTVCNNQYYNFSSTDCGGRNICDEAFECISGETCENGGAVFAAQCVVSTGVFGIFMLSPSLQAINQACGSGYEVFKTIEESENTKEKCEGEKVESLKGKIEFKHIKFHYPNRKEQNALDDLNITIEAGKRIGIVGSSGCGKSTLLQLLQRLYDDYEGEILVDEKNIKNYNLSSYRMKIGVVSQEPILFRGSVKDNIRLGKLDCSDEEIIKVAKQTNAHNFITRFPNGYDTLVGESGHSLSGGEKQRIAIARALIRDPSILVLDEATSGLDSESEKIVQDASDELLKDKQRTTLIVAHRLSTIESADEIIVIDEGRVVERGTHSELMEKGGIYSKLREKQMLKTDNVNKNDNCISPISPNVETDGINSSQEIRKSSEIKTSEIIHPEKIDNNKQSSSTWSILRYAFDNKWIDFLALLSSMINGAILPCYSLFFGGMVSSFYESDIHELMIKMRNWYLSLVAFYIVICSFMGIQSLLFGIISGRFAKKVKNMSYKSLMKQDMKYYDDNDHSTGAISTLLSSNISLLQSSLQDKSGMYFQTIFTVITGLIIAFIASWKVALVICIIIPFIVVGGYFRMKTAMKIMNKIKKPTEEVGSIVSESVNNIKTVKSLSIEEYINEKFKTTEKDSLKVRILDALYTGFFQGYNEVFDMSGYAIAFGIGGTWAVDGLCPVGNLISVLVSINAIAQVLSNSTSFANDVAQVKTATERVYEICNSNPDVDISSNDGDTPEISGEIEFKDVKFRYPTRLDVPVLRKLNLKIKKGEKVALVGESGCGKSTIIGLLERFYNVDSGSILIDGHDIKSINLKYLRKQFGLVSQEPVLFSATIEDNIKMGDYGNEKITHEDVVTAAKAANAHNFIMEFPEGYKTEVGNKGGSLSGGQKQRIAIARAILRNPKILLLDEATSALDSESELIVQEAIDKLLESSDRTSIIIAHRLSTIQNADKIIVLDKGRVVEVGKHEELMKIENGLYRQLATRQMLVN